MHSRVDRYDPYVRAAIFYEYGGLCFHDEEPLCFREMQLDHIIPQDMFKKGKEKELAEILTKFDLPSNLHRDCLRNLVPSRGKNNRDRGKTMYTDSITSNMFKATENMAPKIIKRITSFKKQFESDVDITKIAMQLDRLKNVIDLADIYDTLSGETTFEAGKQLWDSGYLYSYEKSLPNVVLQGYLPKYPKRKGSCTLKFKSLKIRDCAISLNHSQILTSLFSGINTDKQYGLRRFLVNYNETYFVQLGNVRLPLSHIEVEQLCEIVDDFARYYLLECKKMQLVFRPDIFTPTNAIENGQRILGISENLWKEMIDFCREFDCENGDSEWHIFDSSSNFIKIYTQHEHSIFEPGYHAFLIPEQEGETYTIRNGYSTVWIVWTDKFFIEKENDPANYCFKKQWGPVDAYNWLTGSFIPFMKYHNSVKKYKNNIFKKQTILSFEEFLKTFSLEAIMCYSSRIVEVKKDLNGLKKQIEDLQIFFSAYFSEDFYQKDQLIGLYESLFNLINLSQMDDKNYNYIVGNLSSIVEGKSKSDILTSITSCISNLDDDVVYSARLDYIFRSMLCALENGISYLSEDEIDQYFFNLSPFIEKMEQVRLIHFANM